jgi:hypothetical protein
MAFDIEGARKAGYSDAEIAQHLAREANFDLNGAKQAGYSDGEVIAELAGKVGARAEIPGQDPSIKAPPAVAPAAAPPAGIVDRAIGAGEAALATATGATGGTIGLAHGTVSGMLDALFSGRFGTPEAANMVEQRAMQGAQALTYEPRTPEGQRQAAAVGQALQQVVPVAAVAPGMMPAVTRTPSAAPAGVVARAAAEGTVRSVAGDAAAAGAARAIDAAGRVAELGAKGATTLPRRALEALRKEPEATPGTMGSVGSAGTDAAAQRTATAANLPVPVRLTKGQASRDPAQLKFEVETAKLPEQGAALRQRYVEQNDAILRNFDSWLDQTGAEAPTLRAVGTSVDRALVEQAARDKAQIRAAYRAAEKSGEMEAPITLSSVVEHLNESAPDAAVAPLLDVARRRALQLGIAAERDGQLVPQPVPLKTAELYRRAIGNATDYEPTNVRQATIIKGLVDETTEGMGGDLYRSARQLRARYAQNYENRGAVSKLLSTRRGTTDRQVAFEDVFDHTVLKGSLDDVRNVRRVLQRGGEEGQQAWRELQGASIKWIRDEATKSVATDSTGNRVISPAALDKAIRTLDHDGRLDFIFGKRGAQQLRDINELAQIAKTVPPEAAINTSNTASTLLAGFVDAGLIGSTGGALPIPVATMFRVVRQHVKDRALRKRIEEALGEQIKKQAPNNKRKAPAVQEPPADATIH